jgi:hypothetical protein
MDMCSRMAAENFCSQLNDDWVLIEYETQQAEKENSKEENN